MATEAGYWSRVIVPKMDEAIEKEGFSTARDRILGKLPKKTIREQPVGAPKGKAKSTPRPTNYWNWKESRKPVGGKPTDNLQPDDNSRMYPDGARLSETERSCAVANGARNSSNKPLCWDFNSHGGCRYGNKCFNMHETMLPAGAHWCVRAEMLRRGGGLNKRNASTPLMWTEWYVACANPTQGHQEHKRYWILNR